MTASHTKENYFSHLNVAWEIAGKLGAFGGILLLLKNVLEVCNSFLERKGAVANAVFFLSAHFSIGFGGRVNQKNRIISKA